MSTKLNAKQVMNKYPDLHKWFVAGKSRWAVQMMDNLRKWNSLSQNQIDASIRIMQDETAREAQAYIDKDLFFANAENRKDGAAMPPGDQNALTQPAVDMAKIEIAFEAAIQNGIKRPKMKLDTLKFSKAPAGGSNPGAIYVNRIEDGEYMGKIFAGRIKLSYNAPKEVEAEIKRVAEDPEGAAKAYGLRTGECCICSRPLTNGESIDLGIGPICREKFGW